MIWLIFVFELLVTITMVISINLLMKRKSYKAFQYLIFWFLICLGVFIRLSAEYPSSYNLSMRLKTMSLIVNSFAYLFLIIIYMADSRCRGCINNMYFLYLTSMSVWLFVFYFSGKETYIVLFFNLIWILYAAYYSIIYSRFWFAFLCVTTGLYFFLTGLSLMSTGDNLVYVWLLNIFAVFFGVMGTWEDGNNGKNS